MDQLHENGIDNILALRGDFPEDPNFEFPNPLHYTYAKELIAQLEKRKNLSIGAACYPEGHIECDSKIQTNFQQKHSEIYFLTMNYSSDLWKPWIWQESIFQFQQE